MRIQLAKIALSVSFGLALALTLSCSSDDDDKGAATISSSSVELSSSSFFGTSGTFADDRDNIIYKWVKIGEQIWMAENLNYNAIGSICYGSLEDNCTAYGKLYDWSTAKDASTCPSGWHLPNKNEWNALIDAITVAGDSLTAEDGFAALLGGYGDSDGSFYNNNNVGLWWNASEDEANSWYIGDDYTGWVVNNKLSLLSVRCLQNEEIPTL